MCGHSKSKLPECFHELGSEMKKHVQDEFHKRTIIETISFQKISDVEYFLVSLMTVDKGNIFINGRTECFAA